jgi:hypothetical protein
MPKDRDDLKSVYQGSQVLSTAQALGRRRGAMAFVAKEILFAILISVILSGVFLIIVAVSSYVMRIM